MPSDVDVAVNADVGVVEGLPYDTTPRHVLPTMRASLTRRAMDRPLSRGPLSRGLSARGSARATPLSPRLAPVHTLEHAHEIAVPVGVRVPARSPRVSDPRLPRVRSWRRRRPCCVHGGGSARTSAACRCRRRCGPSREQLDLHSKYWVVYCRWGRV
jgi:hypothetical protein